MAISEDTAALVAAQLTAAWATRVGQVDPRGLATTHDEAVLARYQGFLATLRATGGAGYDINKLT